MPFRNLQAFHCISGVCFRRLYFVSGVLPNPLFRDILNNGIVLYMIINSYYYNRDSKNCKENRKDPKRKRLEELTQTFDEVYKKAGIGVAKVKQNKKKVAKK